MSTIAGTPRPLNEAVIDELDKLISTPLDYLVLKVIKLENYQS